jgi:hypothetical protein
MSASNRLSGFIRSSVGAASQNRRSAKTTGVIFDAWRIDFLNLPGIFVFVDL